jgi:hypothetical protein
MPAATHTRAVKQGVRPPVSRSAPGRNLPPEARAVLALQRQAGNRATRALMRQPSKTVPAPWPTEDAGPEPQPVTIKSYSARGDVVTVEMSDGKRWKVTRKRSTVPIVRKKGQFGISPGYDADRIWLKASWCRGTRGEIRVGGNPQGAAKEVLKNLAQGIANGGNADDVKRIITAAEIEPFVDWDIQRPGDWKITGEVKLTFDQSGLKSAGGKIGVAKGPFEGGLEGKGDRDGSWNVTVTGTWTPGGETKTKEKCAEDELFFPYEYDCVLEWDVAEKRTPVEKTAEDRYEQHRYVYFKYASDEVNKALTPKAELDALGELMAGGYKVVNVQAFTSPEGLRDPSPKWKEGNKALSLRRAQKALQLAEAACSNGGCVTGGVSEPRDVELLPSDLETLNGGKTEFEGKILEEDVIRAWEDGSSEDIREQKTPAADKRVKAARGRHAKAEVIYEYLRRSRIDLLKVVPRTYIDIEVTPAHTERRTRGCPKEILDAARAAWNSTGI